MTEGNVRPCDLLEYEDVTNLLNENLPSSIAGVSISAAEDGFTFEIAELPLITDVTVAVKGTISWLERDETVTLEAKTTEALEINKYVSLDSFDFDLKIKNKRLDHLTGHAKISVMVGHDDKSTGAVDVQFEDGKIGFSGKFNLARLEIASVLQLKEGTIEVNKDPSAGKLEVSIEAQLELTLSDSDEPPILFTLAGAVDGDQSLEFTGTALPGAFQPNFFGMSAVSVGDFKFHGKLDENREFSLEATVCLGPFEKCSEEPLEVIKAEAVIQYHSAEGATLVQGLSTVPSRKELLQVAESSNILIQDLKSGAGRFVMYARVNSVS